MTSPRLRRSLRLSAAALLLLPVALAGRPAAACSPEPYLGSLCLFGGNFAIRGYAKAEGQLLPIAQNQALFSLLGTTYGGDGRTTFALPDLRGRVPVGASNTIRLGAKGGSETTTLTQNQMPPHSHQATATTTGTDSTGNATSPGNAVWATDARSDGYFSGTPASSVTMSSDAVTVSVANTGGGEPFSNMQPYLGMTWLIAIQGVYPSRN